MKTMKSGVKAGGLTATNHGLRVKANVKAGGMMTVNHGLRVNHGLVVRTA